MNMCQKNRKIFHGQIQKESKNKKLSISGEFLDVSWWRLVEEVRTALMSQDSIPYIPKLT